jgi:hypothetical protein
MREHPSRNSAFAERLRAKLKDASKGEPNTWGFVAMFMEMIDEAEKECASSEKKSIEDTVELPKEPPEAWFRPFIMCPADEVLIAWQAFLKIAERMRGDLGTHRQSTEAK